MHKKLSDHNNMDLYWRSKLLRYVRQNELKELKSKNNKVKWAKLQIIVIALFVIVIVIVLGALIRKYNDKQYETTSIDLSIIPIYSGKSYVEINKNSPSFTDDEKILEPFEIYSELDTLGRCGIAYANICPELMPTEGRDEIGMIKPSGWHTVKYNDLIDGNYLYNRCHLIAFCLAGENANEKNLITGTRYLNVEGMLPFEILVADYVEKTGNHVLYRVTPIYDGDNLIAKGVQIEAWSVEDDGKGICFNVYCYNVQPGIDIDYKTGESKRK